MTNNISPAAMPRKVTSTPAFIGNPGTETFPEFVGKVEKLFRNASYYML